ncbi:25300_t:CDS:2 [Dentiscutata erythropus]|uniref:25300_t:CDS:1 n=1 Tax=Dentiscutata erythropus TaxID=1348616 RepID=A0A9N8VWJ2_9GLOM|nr:25300_t:CDS:2 [Dentiscutata erythropus]
MPCYTDMIVRVKFVRQGEKSTWAIGAYPVGREDSEIELVLFVPSNSDGYNLETYAVLKKDGIYSVRVSTCMGIPNKGDKFNKCPLKVTLVGIPQELPQVFDNDFYVYVKDINYVNTHFSSKLGAFDSSDLNNSSDTVNLTLGTTLVWVSNDAGSKSKHGSLVLDNNSSSKKTKVECSEDFTSDIDNVDNYASKLDEVIDVDEVFQSNETQSGVKKREVKEILMVIREKVVVLVGLLVVI